jgi:hypothetical protein
VWEVKGERGIYTYRVKKIQDGRTNGGGRRQVLGSSECLYTELEISFSVKNLNLGDDLFKMRVYSGE